MEAIDKFGNRIYDTTYSRMLAYGLLLKKAGYVESHNKPNLFYKHIDEVTFFADMRGTDEVKTWEQTAPLFYYKFEDNVPIWKQERLLNEELSRLTFPIRTSFYSFENLMDVFYSLKENEGNNLGCDYSGECRLPDGYCIICGKDFQDDRYFCSHSCFEIAKKRDFARTINVSDACEICGIKIPYKKIRNEMEDALHIKLPALAILHHTDYANNKTMLVCPSCHAKIHHSKDPAYAKYRPIDKRPKIKKTMKGEK